MNYRYFIDGTEVYPKNTAIPKLVYERKTDSSIVLEKSLDQAFLFHSKEDFDFVAQETEDMAKELTFIIKEKCDSSWVELIELYFCIAEGKFDNDKCLFSVKPRTREEFVKDIPINILLSPGRVTHTLGYGVTTLFSGGRRYEQAFHFADLVLYVAQKSNPRINGIISDFFQINPVNISTDALPGVTNFWTKLIFCALSDVQEPIPSDLARTEFVTFREIMDDLLVLFRVYWFIDEDFNLRIEHESFFSGTTGLDLTQSKYVESLKATNKYSYDLTNIPKTEQLNTIGSPQYAKITYGGLSNINKDRTVVAKTTGKIRTDYTSIVLFNGSSSEDGLFLFATSEAAGIYTMIEGGSTTVDDYTGQNGVLTPDYLFRRLHTYERFDRYAFFESGTILPSYPQMRTCAGGFNAVTTRPIKTQEQIKFNYCCDDTLDTKEQVKTKMSDGYGDGYIQKAELDLKTRMMTMQLKYKITPFEFKPTDLPGLDLWLRGDAGITASPVFPYECSQWDDYSGNGRHAIQTNPANKPYAGGITAGFYPGLPHKGVTFAIDRRLVISPGFQLFPNKRGTLIVLYYDGDLDTKALISTHNTNPFDNFFDLIYSQLTLVHNTGDIYVPQLPYVTSGLISLRRIEDSKMSGRHNGMDIRNFMDASGNDINNPMTVDNVNITVNDIIIGSNPDAATDDPFGLAVTISEIIIYDHVLTDEELDKVELYLVKKGYYNPYPHV